MSSPHSLGQSNTPGQMPTEVSVPSSSTVPWKVKRSSPEEYEQRRVGKYTSYFQGNIILPIPEITASLELVLVEIKSKRMAGLKRDSFMELLRIAGILALYFCRRILATWDVLLPPPKTLQPNCTRIVLTQSRSDFSVSAMSQPFYLEMW